MNPFEMVVAIIVVITIGKVLQARFGVGQDKRDSRFNLRRDDAATENENQRLREELKAMKDRLAVLERLATDSNDSGARLDREIEKLRDRS
ncbi:cell shape-determining protein MreC [Sphingomonas sp. UYAg733]